MGPAKCKRNLITSADGRHATDYKFWGLTECDGVQRPAVRGQRAEVRGQVQGSGKAPKGGKGARQGRWGEAQPKHTGARPVDGAGRGQRGAEQPNSLLTQGAQGTQKERKRFWKESAQAGQEGRCGAVGERKAPKGAGGRWGRWGEASLKHTGARPWMGRQGRGREHGAWSKEHGENSRKSVCARRAQLQNSRTAHGRTRTDTDGRRRGGRWGRWGEKGQGRHRRGGKGFSWNLKPVEVRKQRSEVRKTEQPEA